MTIPGTTLRVPELSNSQSSLDKYERGVTGIPCIGTYSNENFLMLLLVVTPKELPCYHNQC